MILQREKILLSRALFQLKHCNLISGQKNKREQINLIQNELSSRE